jgi:predicted amidophosphoribosyltransferase
MNAMGISLGVLILVVAVLLLHRMHRNEQAGGARSQRMCPFCGLITSRLKACCLECGKPFTAVVYSTSKK